MELKRLTKQKNIKKVIIFDKQGFTLIELLVVIAILGILAGSILISVFSIRERSERNSLMRTMGTIVRAAGACDSINYASSGSICLIPAGGSMNYPVLDLKLSNKGYVYGWGGRNLIGMKGIESIIICYVGSGSCEFLP